MSGVIKPIEGFTIDYLWENNAIGCLIIYNRPLTGDFTNARLLADIKKTKTGKTKCKWLMFTFEGESTMIYSTLSETSHLHSSKTVWSSNYKLFLLPDEYSFSPSSE